MIIYSATNKLNGKKYIGQTSQTLNARIRHHLRSAELKRYGTYFHRALLKYGSNSFEWEIIEICNSREANKKEKYYIYKFDTFVNGYNMTLGGMGNSNIGGENHPMFGKHHSDETKQKLRDFNLGKKLSKKTRKRISAGLVGRVCSEETRMKLSKAHSGKILSKETIAKIRKTKKGTMRGKKNPFYGKKHPKELQGRITDKLSLDWVIEFLNGDKKKIRNLKYFCKKNSLCLRRMYDVADGKIDCYKGFKCKKVYSCVIKIIGDFKC